MYTASNEFHEAVANGAPQIAMLVFSDAIFTNSDIDVEAGIELDEYFGTEEDITIGQALSNELRFTLFNDSRLLNDYAFGEFNAYIGARVDRSATSTSDLHASLGSTWKWKNGKLYRGNSQVSSQPSFTVTSIVIVREKDGTQKVHVFGGGQCKSYTSAGAAITYLPNAAMIAKGNSLAGRGYTVYFDSSFNATVTVFGPVYDEEYEFVPLGRFIAKRPNVPDVNQINFTCHDQMTKFDTDMPTAEELSMTYPATFGTLFVRMCTKMNVPYSTAAFINNGATITAEPEEFRNATMRQVLQWLAEAAGSVLRFDRDGVLRFDWIHTNTGISLTETDYSEYNPYWYETPQVDKLYNRNSQSGVDNTVGSGSVGYLIQDNPLLKGVS